MKKVLRHWNINSAIEEPFLGSGIKIIYTVSDLPFCSIFVTFFTQ